MTAQMSRAEILALPPTHLLPTLGKILGLSEPTVREQHRSGRLDEIGIKVVSLGAKHLVVTASVWAFLGLDPAADGAGSDAGADGADSEAEPRRPARQGKATASALRSVPGDEVR